MSAAGDSDVKFYQLDEEDNEKPMSDATKAVYYCGDEDDGHAKKNKWMKTWLPNDTNEEEDDKEWFWFDKEGKLFRAGYNTAAETASNAWKYKLDEGTLVQDANAPVGTIGKKKVNSKDYWFREDGVMLSKFYMLKNDSAKDSMFYFGGSDDGSMKTGSQSVKDDNGDSYKFFFENKTTGNTKGLGITGNKSGYLYFKGLLIKADDYKYQLATITDENGVEHTFIVNKNGSIQKNRVDYKEDNEVLFTTKNLPKDAFVTDSTAWKYSLKDGLTVEDDITTPIDIYDVMPQN